MQIRNVAVVNALGLHARACAQVVRLAHRFSSNIWLVAKGRRASARSMVAVMMLAASMGTAVVLEADGPDEREAVEAIVSLFGDGFGERS